MRVGWLILQRPFRMLFRHLRPELLRPLIVPLGRLGLRRLRFAELLLAATGLFQQPNVH